MWYLIAGVAILLILVVWLAVWFGKESAKRKQAEQQSREQSHDAEIASQPFVPKPFGGMRPKD